MDDLHAQGARKTTSIGRGVPDASGQAGIIGIGLAAVLTFALAQGAWEWFASYIGVTLLAVILSFYRLPPWRPGLRSAYARNLVAYSLVVGLCAAIALAPVLQRSAWLFPMPGTRSHCRALGTYESLRTEASLRAAARITNKHVMPSSADPSTWKRLPSLEDVGVGRRREGLHVVDG